MEIYVVQPGDTIQSIAERYKVTAKMLIQDNGLDRQDSLVTGQSIVIAKPEITYIVKKGETLFDIAKKFNVTIMKLLMNNPYLSDREHIYPGDIIVIKYNTKGNITTHGNTVPYINKTTLRKTLPYLTYLSILNYTATKEGEIISYYDDSEVIRIAKGYGVMPLMLLTTQTIQGEQNIEIAYDILLNKDFQNRQIENVIKILKEKGYYGINISFEYISISNINLYESYFSNIAQKLRAEGFLVFTTINTNIKNVFEQISFEQVDYSILNDLTNNIIFMNFEWAKNINPPSPISSIYNIDLFLNYISKFISPYKEIIGLATIGYDWELPFSVGLSNVYTLTIKSAIDLARNVGANIQFDDKSQTPYFKYEINKEGNQIEHIVWFIDARSINALLNLVLKYKLHGTGIWNITIYNPQLWLIINSQYDIDKVIF